MGIIETLFKLLGKASAAPTPTQANLQPIPPQPAQTPPSAQAAVFSAPPAEAHQAAPAGEFSPAFKKAFAKAMRWETGRPIDLNDPEIQKGLIGTPAQRAKVGYTDGVSGASKFDSGGETKFGVAQKAHPEVVVRTLTLAQAEAIYKRSYWDSVRGDELDPDVARYVFDIGCGSGPQKGIKLLQQACGVAADGVFGPATLAAAKAAKPAELVEKMRQLRVAYYQAIVANNPSQKIFLQGWLNRANDI